MMDPAAKEKFKWKFYRLAVMLNIIILLVAIAILVLLKAPEDYRLPLFLLIVLFDGIFTVYFLGQYRKTRRWLDDQD